MIRALIVDDEALAREGIRVHLRDEHDIEIVGEAADGPSAVKAIKKLEPDLLFLDVQMPGLNGLEVLRRVSADHLPAVIFVTAYDRYAINAFEARALDYLLKPINRKRFQDAVQRARLTLAREQALESTHERLIELLHARVPAARPAASAPEPQRANRLVVKDRDRFLLIKTDEVDWIESSANYVDVHARGRSFLLRLTMSAVEEKLDPRHFARIHRSVIVNVNRVKEIKTTASHGDFEVVLEQGTTLRMSRSYRDRLLRD